VTVAEEEEEEEEEVPSPPIFILHFAGEGRGGGVPWVRGRIEFYP
jgi:hypothetical protein